MFCFPAITFFVDKLFNHLCLRFCGFQDKVDTGIEAEGSNLSGVSSRCLWEEVRDWDGGHQSVSQEFMERDLNNERQRDVETDKPYISRLGEKEAFTSTLMSLSGGRMVRAPGRVTDMPP